jgi:hypothetical protein
LQELSFIAKPMNPLYTAFGGERAGNLAKIFPPPPNTYFRLFALITTAIERTVRDKPCDPSATCKISKVLKLE